MGAEHCKNKIPTIVAAKTTVALSFTALRQLSLYEHGKEVQKQVTSGFSSCPRCSSSSSIFTSGLVPPRAEVQARANRRQAQRFEYSSVAEERAGCRHRTEKHGRPVSPANTNKFLATARCDASQPDSSSSSDIRGTCEQKTT